MKFVPTNSEKRGFMVPSSRPWAMRLPVSWYASASATPP
jgi:hypothetical protein